MHLIGVPRVYAGNKVCGKPLHVPEQLFGDGTPVQHVFLAEKCPAENCKVFACKVQFFPGTEKSNPF